MGSLPMDIVVFKKAAGLLNTLDNDTRYEMLTLMHTKGSMTVTELHMHFELDQSHASYHLRLLRNAGFVQTTRK